MSILKRLATRGTTKRAAGGARTIKKVNYTNLPRTKGSADSERRAMHPGKRVSKTGKIYYEYRDNRADLNRKTGL